MELPELTECAPDSPRFDRLRLLLSQLRTTCDEIESEIQLLSEAAETHFTDAFTAREEPSNDSEPTDDVAEMLDSNLMAEMIANQLPDPVDSTSESEAKDEQEGVALELPTEESALLNLSENELGSVLESFTDEPAEVSSEASVEAAQALRAESEPITGVSSELEPENESVNISAMLESRTPTEAVVPPAEGGTVLSEDELLAMLSEAESRAEDIDGEEGDEESQLTVIEGGNSEGNDANQPVTFDETLVASVPAVLALAALAVPVRKDGDTLVLAVAEPIDPVAISNIESHLGSSVATEPRPMVEILELLRAIYKDGKVPVA
ncbi:MAG: hypothetical protein KF812_00480 [Fimbriimonadaceae bacterium]|nr:hypothetical protein [Fimbriimonadaceae bacterium]